MTMAFRYEKGDMIIIGVKVPEEGKKRWLISIRIYNILDKYKKQ